MRLISAALTAIVLAAGPAFPNPQPIAHYLAQGAQAESRKEFHEACRAYLDGLSQHPGNPELKRALNRAATRWSNSRDAEAARARSALVRDAQRSVERTRASQKHLDGRCREGKVHRKKGRLLQASDVQNRILREAPGHEGATRELIHVQTALAKQLRRGRFASPQLEAAARGIYAYNAGIWDRAAEDLAAACSGPSAGLPEAIVLARLPDYAALARENLEREQWRRERDGLMARAKAEETAGRLDAARELYRGILAKDPADAGARRALDELGVLGATVQKAVREDARRKQVPDLLVKSTLLMVQERYVEALEVLDRVLVIDPANREALDQVAEIKRIMKGRRLYAPPVAGQTQAEEKYREGVRFFGDERYKEARASFEEALRLDPRHEEARQALRKLKAEGH